MSLHAFCQQALKDAMNATVPLNTPAHKNRLFAQIATLAIEAEYFDVTDYLMTFLVQESSKAVLRRLVEEKKKSVIDQKKSPTPGKPGALNSYGFKYIAATLAVSGFGLLSTLAAAAPKALAETSGFATNAVTHLVVSPLNRESASAAVVSSYTNIITGATNALQSSGIIQVGTVILIILGLVLVLAVVAVLVHRAFNRRSVRYISTSAKPRKSWWRNLIGLAIGTSLLSALPSLAQNVQTVVTNVVAKAPVATHQISKAGIPWQLGVFLAVLVIGGLVVNGWLKKRTREELKAIRWKLESEIRLVAEDLQKQYAPEYVLSLPLDRAIEQQGEPYLLSVFLHPAGDPFSLNPLPTMHKHIFLKDIDQTIHTYASWGIDLDQKQAVRLLVGAWFMSSILAAKYKIPGDALIVHGFFPTVAARLSREGDTRLSPDHLPVSVYEMQSMAASLMDKYPLAKGDKVNPVFAEDARASLSRTSRAIALLGHTRPILRTLFKTDKVKVTYAGIEFTPVNTTPKTIGLLERALRPNSETAAEIHRFADVVAETTITKDGSISPTSPVQWTKDEADLLKQPGLAAFDQSSFENNLDIIHRHALRAAESKKSLVENSIAVLMTEAEFAAVLRATPGLSAASLEALMMSRRVHFIFLNETDRDLQTNNDATSALASIISQIPLATRVNLISQRALKVQSGVLGQTSVFLFQFFPVTTTGVSEGLTSYLIAMKQA